METGEAFMKEVLAAVEKLPALREREANLARGEQAYQEWDAAQEKARGQEKEVDTQKAACARLTVTARSLTESLSPAGSPVPGGPGRLFGGRAGRRGALSGVRFPETIPRRLARERGPWKRESWKSCAGRRTRPGRP